MINPPIDTAEFHKIDIRVGTIVTVEPFPEARNPAYKLWIDFGPEIGIKKSSAQITHNYPDLKKLLGKQVVAVVNLASKQIGPFRSEVLTLGLSDDDGKVFLVAPDGMVPNGKRLY